MTTEFETSFADLGLSAPIISALNDLGYEKPSPIQAECIPHLLNGRDVLGMAQTGSGKTAAFSLPLLHNLQADLKAPQILVLAPTRELAVQVAEAMTDFSKHMNGVNNMTDGEVSELNIVLKSDVQGSCEAISDSLLKLSTDEVKVKIVGSGVGGITETDATLAAASNAIILGFNVRADASARRVIEAESLDLRYYSVIYNLIDEVKQAMSGMLAPEYKQQIIGLAEVRDVFKSPKFGAIAGCMVTEGTIKRHNPIRVLRDNVVIYEGELESLRRFKDDVNEVRNGMECGIGVKNYNDVRVGDMIEVFEIIEIQRTIA